ncbi:MAG: nucleotidyltransferase family protein [Nibricoccus sp.]
MTKVHSGAGDFPFLSGIILAAGLSRRAIPRNKLLLPARDGDAVVRCVATAFCEAGLREVVVVTGHESERVEEALAGLPIRFVFATEYRGGMGFSLAAGIRAAAKECRGLLVSPGDLPKMRSDIVRQIAGEFERQKSMRNVVPTFLGRRGHPVALVADLRPKLETLVGDRGAKGLLADPAEAERTVFLPVSDEAICADNDGG